MTYPVASAPGVPFPDRMFDIVPDVYGREACGEPGYVGLVASLKSVVTWFNLLPYGPNPCGPNPTSAICELRV